MARKKRIGGIFGERKMSGEKRSMWIMPVRDTSRTQNKSDMHTGQRKGN